jgi:hypothetical protein
MRARAIFDAAGIFRPANAGRTEYVLMQELHAALPDSHDRELADAVAALENPNIAARIADYAGAPVNRVLSLLPKQADKGLTKVVEAAMLRCLKTAIKTLDGQPPERRPATMLSSVAVGVTGGLSGLVGLAALPVELPVTTMLMLRSIADIARANGEDLGQLEPRLACLQVFALGGRGERMAGGVGYYAARALLMRATSHATAHLLERGALEVTGPAMSKLLAELVSRFSIVLTDRIAAGAVPVIGAVGGATINVIFMKHFQQVARGHFAVRRLERRYGAERVRHHYHRMAGERRAAR